MSKHLDLLEAARQFGDELELLEHPGHPNQAVHGSWAKGGAKGSGGIKQGLKREFGRSGHMQDPSERVIRWAVNKVDRKKRIERGGQRFMKKHKKAALAHRGVRRILRAGAAASTTVNPVAGPAYLAVDRGMARRAEKRTRHN